MPDHYAALGVSPTSEDVVIRAAYLALMRRYHPDANPSERAAARAQAITEAYAVLSEPERRAEYDRMLAARAHRKAARQWQSADRPDHSAALGRRIFGAGSVLLMLLLLAVAWPLLEREPPDRLAELSSPAAAVREQPDPAVRCGSPSAGEALKRELFRRAARLRGRDSATFERLAAAAVVRIESPMLTAHDRKLGTVSCTATVALDLPPGVSVTGGGRSLAADVSYSLPAAARASPPLRLSNDGLIVAPLATLAQVRPPAEDFLVPPPPASLAEAIPQARVPAPALPQSRIPSAAPAPRATASAAAQKQPEVSPSFSCRFASGRGEIAVCNSAELAKLDRHLAMLYGQSWGHATDAQRAQLLNTRDGFLQRRDSCRSESCVNAAYLARMREIGEIMTRR